MTRGSKIGVGVAAAVVVVVAVAIVAVLVTRGGGSGGQAGSSGSNAPSGGTTSGGVTQITNVKYANTTCQVSGDDSVTEGDLYLPTKPIASPTPAVVFVHGGSFRAGGRDTSSYQAMSHELAAMGWAVYNIDYCLADDTHPGYPMQVQQVQAAITYLTSSAFTSTSKGLTIDGSRIAVWGGSAGAALAAEAGVTLGTPKVAAVVGWSGPYNFVDIGGPHPDKFVAPPIFLGCDPQTTSTCATGVAVKASPALNVTSSTSPMILYQGDSELVPEVQIQQMTAALKAKDVPVQSTVLSGAPGNKHATGYTSTAFCPTVAYLKPYLGGVNGTCTEPANGTEAR